MVTLSTLLSLLFFLSISSTGATYSGNWALSFDGIQSIVKIGHMYTDLSLADEWTLEAWIKPYGNQDSQFQPNIVGFPGRHPNLELCGNSPNQPGCPGGPTKTLAQLRERNGTYYTMVGQALGDTTNTWYHLAASWNNVTLISYINGNMDANKLPYSEGYIEPLNCSFTLCDEGIDIGGYRFLQESGTYFTGQYFRGLIDEVRVWNKGRTQDQIKNSMYSTLSGNEAGLVYYWRFDEGMGLLVNSLAMASYGTLGGGITAAEPRWVQSDAPINNAFPTPSPAAVTCNSNEAGVYVAGSILGILFILIGIIIGVFGYKRFCVGDGYQPVK
jgi:hypothetical protein